MSDGVFRSDSQVSDALVVQHINHTQDHKANHGDEKWDCNVDRSLTEVVGALSEDDDKDGTDNVGSDRIEVGLNGRKTKATDNLGKEVSTLLVHVLLET